MLLPATFRPVRYCARTETASGTSQRGWSLAIFADLINDLHLTRLNAHYDEVTRLARAILTFAGLAHGPGLTPSPAFLINMNDVFEDFVHASLSHVLQGKVEVSRHRVTSARKQA